MTEQSKLKPLPGPSKRIQLKYAKEMVKFNQVKTSFPKAESVLSAKELNLLHILETRSEPNNGDTKICDKSLGTILQRSRQQICRYLRKLEDLGFIARLSIKRKSKKSGGVYTDRTFRCRRILLKNRFDWKRDLGWKTDNRPRFKKEFAFDETTDKRVHLKWTLPWGAEIMIAKTRKVMKSAWEWYPELCKMNLLDSRQQKLLQTLRNMKEIDPNHIEATLIMGKRFATEHN